MPKMLERFMTRDWLLFAIVSVVFVIVIVGWPSPSGMTVTNGDEPHYLIAAHSLYYDHDFDTSNNYRNQDYRNFYDGDQLEQHLYPFKGKIIPYHAMLGMPLLIMFPYAVAGRIGVLIWLSLLVAGGLVWLYRVVRTYVPDPFAFATVLFCGLTYPLIVYSQQIYPDTIAFTAVTFVLAQIIAPTQQNKRITALMIGVVLGLLPHFHFKFIILSAILYLGFLWQGRRQLRQNLVWSLGPILLLGLAFVAWIYHIYGEFSRDVFIAPSQGIFATGRLDGITGLWFDQEFGLLFFAPFYLMAVLGAWTFWQIPARRQVAFFLMLLYASQHLLSGSFYDWEGGLSPAPRYLVAVLPVLIIFGAQGVADAYRQRQWSQPFALALATLWITRLILFVHRPFMFGYRVGTNTILREHYHFTWLLPLLPSFKSADLTGSYLRLAVLLLVLGGLWGVGTWVNRRLFASNAPSK